MEIVLKDVSFCYRRGNNKGDDVLRGVNLRLQEKKCYLLTGPCGSGKTTLALLMKGLLVPTSGSIFLKNGNVSLSSFRDAIGFSFQFPEEQFFKETVEGEVAYGPIMHNLDRIDERTRDGLNSIGLPYEQFSKSSPFDLSSGEQRRLAIASIIVCDPFWYIFDEPTAGLDFEGRSMIVELVKKFIREGKTVIIISQELELFLDLCNEIIILEEGMVKLVVDTKTFLEKETLNEIKVFLPYHNRVLRILRNRGWEIPVSSTDPLNAASIIVEYKIDKNRRSLEKKEVKK
jgi:energy-coupling factor transport system ATP-binding protein